MIIKTDQFIVINKAGNKILSHSAIRFHDIKDVVKRTKKHWHFRDFLYDNEKDCDDTIGWINSYSKDQGINVTRTNHCKNMLKEGFIIKKATIIFNLDI